MLLVDYVLVGSLLLLVVAWWAAGEPRRTVFVVSMAVLAVVVGAVGLWSHRWQAAPGLVIAALALAGVLVRLLRRRPGRQRTPWFSGSLLALGLAIAFLLPFWHPATPLPEPTGEHLVGVRDFTLVDGARRGLLAAAANEPRKLLIRVWYPAETTEGFERRPYFTQAEAATTATGLGRLMGVPFYFTYVAHAVTNSFVNAPLISGAVGLPVVIYSHGYTSFAGQNTALAEELASHGYIVYSVQHTYDSSPVAFPDGSVADMDPELIANMQAQSLEDAPDELRRGFAGETYDERRAGQLATRAKAFEEGERISTVSAKIWLDDRRFVLDTLEAGAVPARVADVVTAGRYAATGQMGMSFGGSTTGGLCMVDRRCAAGVNLDGGDYHGTPFNANVPVPFLMFYSDYDHIFADLGGKPPAVPHGFNDFSYERHELAGLRQDLVRLKVNDVLHLGVSDFTLFTRNPVRALLFGSIDSGEMIRIQNDFVLGFFDTHLRGADVGFPAAQFARHPMVEEDDTGGVREWWLATHPEDETLRVVLETGLGEVELALYPERAPLSVANFLRYLDGGYYDGAAFYRSVFREDAYGIGVLQGGLLADAMAGDGSGYASPERPFPPIEHEPTTRTGIPNERGTIAWARLEPGSAGSEFFVNLSDNAVLDTGTGGPERDGFGYATFGRVLRGMRVLEAIQRQPRDGETGMDRLKGQILTEPVPIVRAYRVGRL